MDSTLSPQEIFDIIIDMDNLWADTDSLRNCALVSSAWLSPAHISSTVSILNRGDLSDKKKAYAQSSSPYMA